MTPSSQSGLDSIDRFIRVGGEMAKVPILANPQYRAAADDLYQIARRLLDANENMVRWLNRFLLFDFRDTNARAHFLDLIMDYRATKAGGGLRDMKFSCGDIYFIYQRNIADKIAGIFPQDRETGEEAKRAFTALGDSDADMVAFIWGTVVTGIDEFVRNAEHCLDRSDLNGAEAQRLAFKVASSHLSERLDRFESGLSDLVLQYARLANRPVTLT
jgi:hypothetical protein